MEEADLLASFGDCLGALSRQRISAGEASEFSVARPRQRVTSKPT